MEEVDHVSHYSVLAVSSMTGQKIRDWTKINAVERVSCSLRLISKIILLYFDVRSGINKRSRSKDDKEANLSSVSTLLFFIITRKYSALTMKYINSRACGTRCGSFYLPFKIASPQLFSVERFLSINRGDRYAELSFVNIRVCMICYGCLLPIIRFIFISTIPLCCGCALV